ncbi:unnamed protein product [Amoebophrya sp. A25]|nr:unnamed protein product [Amoebophrya sp. A25]|eukprot:GSA25T00005043001.1
MASSSSPVRPLGRGVSENLSPFPSDLPEVDEIVSSLPRSHSGDVKSLRRGEQHPPDQQDDGSFLIDGPFTLRHRRSVSKDLPGSRFEVASSSSSNREPGSGRHHSDDDQMGARRHSVISSVATISEESDDGSTGPSASEEITALRKARQKNSNNATADTKFDTGEQVTTGEPSSSASSPDMVDGNDPTACKLHCPSNSFEAATTPSGDRPQGSPASRPRIGSAQNKQGAIPSVARSGSGLINPELLQKACNAVNDRGLSKLSTCSELEDGNDRDSRVSAALSRVSNSSATSNDDSPLTGSKLRKNNFFWLDQLYRNLFNAPAAPRASPTRHPSASPSSRPAPSPVQSSTSAQSSSNAPTPGQSTSRSVASSKTAQDSAKQSTGSTVPPRGRSMSRGRSGSKAAAAPPVAPVAATVVAPAPSPTGGLFPSEASHTGFWLLWLGMGLSSTLQSFGAGVFLSQGAGSACVALWIFRNVDITQIVVELCQFIIGIFFRDFQSRGAHKIPQGACILCIAPHNNQFLDPVVVGRAFRPYISYPVGYVAAAHSARRPLIGALTRGFGSIPVERPQDVAVKYKAKMRLQGDRCTLLPGEEEAGAAADSTPIIESFHDLPDGCVFIFGSGIQNGVVSEVVSDTQLRFKHAVTVTVSDAVKDKTSEKANDAAEDGIESGDEKQVETPSTYTRYEVREVSSCKIAKAGDSRAFLDACIDRLDSHRVVGIFPEGGSHDRTSLLELKPGVSLLALQASLELKKPIPVVPVGLNYFKGHRFRSRVFVDIEDPIYPSEGLLQEYVDPTTRRQAVGTFLKQISKSLRNVTTDTEDFETLKLYWALRRLYIQPTTRLNYEQKQSMTRAFAEGWPRVKDNAAIQTLTARVKVYTGLLQDYGIHDYMVARLFSKHHQVEPSVNTYPPNGELPCSQQQRDEDEREAQRVLARSLWGTLAHRACLLLLFSLIALPLAVLGSPVMVLAHMVARSKAKEALTRSTVKIAARDVIGTWKVLTAMFLVPALHCFYTFVVYQLSGEPWALSFFFFMPFLYLFAVSIGENVIRIVRSMHPLILLLRKPKLVRELCEKREDCVARTCHAVDQIGWGIRHNSSARSPSLPPSGGSSPASPSVDATATAETEKKQE